MKNNIYLALRYQFRYKSNIFISIIIGIVMFITIVIATYNSSAIDYMNNDYSYYYKLLVIGNNDEDYDKVIDELSSIEHVNMAIRYEMHRSLQHHSALERENLDGNIEIFFANNETLPEIVAGTNFPDDDGNYLICPENFYPYGNWEDLKYMSITSKIDTEDYLNQTFTFNYISHNGTNKFSIEFKVIGLYKNSDYDYDENVCYTKENSLNEIIVNEYSDDFDDDGINRLTYNKDIIIAIDDIENIEYVKNELTNLGYSYRGMISTDYTYFNEITNETNRITIIICSLLLAFMVIVFQKKFNSEKEQYQLKLYLGYKKKDIKAIYFLSNLFNLIISSLIAIAISLYLITFI